MKNTTWLWILFLVVFIAFAAWFIFSGNDAATSFRWWSAKGGW